MKQLPIWVTAAFLLGSISTPLAQEKPADLLFEPDGNVSMRAKLNGRGTFDIVLDPNKDPSAFDLAAAKDLKLGLTDQTKP